MDYDIDKFASDEQNLLNTVTDESVIDSILEEAKYYEEKEKSERRAKLFVGEGAPEIFSTADRTVKTTTTNPLDLTGEFPVRRPETDTDTEDMKVEATLNAAKMLETPDDYEKQDEDFLNPSKNQDTEEKPRGRFEELFGIRTVLNDQGGIIPYEPAGNEMQIPLRNIGFYETVRDEYEEFARVASEKHAAETADEEEKKRQRETVRTVKKVNSSLAYKLMNFFSPGGEDEIDNDGEVSEPIPEEDQLSDYNAKGEEKPIFDELDFRIHSTAFKSVFLFILTLVSGGLAAAVSLIPDKISEVLINAPIIYAIVNLVISAAAIAVSLSTVTNGFVPLVRFKGNSDTAAACACALCTVQAVSALFASENYYKGVLSYYTVAMLAALFANAFGKLIMVKRIKENFKFITSRKPNFAVELYDDEKLSKEMTGGTAASDPIIAYQSRREFLSDFLKLSYAQDKCELVCSRLAPVTLLCSLIIGILYSVMKSSFIGGTAVCAVVSVISVPVCDLLVVNLPLRRFCKELLRKKAMLSGYPSVVKFCQTNAVVIDASELYYNGVSICGLKGFESIRGDDAFLAAAAVLKEADSPISSAFTGFLSKQKNVSLPKVESWVYEENLGLVAWVKNERVIIGSRGIMTKYGVKLPPIGYEEKKRDGSEIAFIAFSGQLAAMLNLKYKPQKAILNELRRAELNGISILVSTTDCNITQEKVAADFDIYYRSVKILSPGHSAIAREKISEKRSRSKAYLATKGGAASMLRALSGCLKLRSAINVGIVLQVISVVLGILLIATLCMFSTVSFVTEFGVVIYMAFWFIAVIIAQRIHRP